jgi:uncharacterized membrane protein YccF (DUF307 family)
MAGSDSYKPTDSWGIVWRGLVGIPLIVLGLALCLTIVGIPLGLPLIFIAGKPLADELRRRTHKHVHRKDGVPKDCKVLNGGK